MTIDRTMPRATKRTESYGKNQGQTNSGAQGSSNLVINLENPQAWRESA